MKKLLFFFLLLTSTLVSAQDTFAYTVQVIVESAYIRTLPDKEALPAASVFQNQSLVATGRNMDGLWIEVRRPFNADPIGWISRDLVALTFEVARLPITDSVTGLIGTEPVVDTGYAVLTLDDVLLRNAAERDAATLEIIPVFFTLPVIERTPNLQWLKVNYRGTVGWISQFQTSTSADLAQVPISPEYATDARYSDFATITPEQQIAQVDRVMAFVTNLKQTTADVAYYWNLLSLGETLECTPIAGNFDYYAYTSQDIVELPELRQQISRLRRAVDDINASISVMQSCGIYTQGQIRAAYSKALNAQLMLRLVTQSMDNARNRIPRSTSITTSTGG